MKQSKATPGIRSQLSKALCVCVLAMLGAELKAQVCNCDQTGIFVGSAVNKENYSDLGLSGPVYNQQFVVCGQWRIDQSAFIRNSTFFMNEDAEIIIESGNSLYLYADTIFGCNAMWRRILVENNAHIVSTNNYFADAADAAIDVDSSASATIFGSTFDRNEVSIRNESPMLSVRNNTFLANNFNFGFVGYNDDQPHIGIHILNTNCNIGSVAAQPNIFSGPFRFGILSTKSFVHISHNQFENINKLFPATQNWIGTGISGNNNSMLIVQNNTFEDCTVGVHLQTLTSGQIEQNTFTNFTVACAGGIDAPASVAVIDNTIGNSSGAGTYGVRFESYGGRLLSANNFVRTDSRDGQGSQLFAGRAISHHGTPSNSLIRDNVCELIYTGTNRGIGISMNSVPNGTIYENDIYIDSGNDGFSGLQLTGTVAAQVKNNLIKASMHGNNTGIDATDALLSNFCCNTDSLLNIGFNFRGQSDNTLLGTSNIFDCNFGLLVHRNAVIGLQILTGNRWFGSFANWGALNLNNNLALIDASMFVVPNINQPEGPGTYTPTRWFIDLAQSTDYPCSSIDACTPGDAVISYYDTLFVSGYLDTLLEQGSRWIRATDLYSKIHNHPALYGSSQLIDNWYDAQQSGIIHNYVRMRDSSRMLFEVSAGDQDSLDDWRDSIYLYFQHLSTIDSGLAADTSIGWESYDSIRSPALNKIGQFTSFIHDKTAHILNERQSFAQSLIYSNAQLSTTTLPAYYERMYHDILFRTLGSGVDSFTNAQKDSLFMIAQLCPDIGGKAVYWARDLYQYIEQYDFDNVELCTPPQQIVKPNAKSGAQQNTPHFSIAPNPSRGQLVLTVLTAFENAPCSVQVLDLNGKKWWQGQFEANRNIDLQALPPGTYILRIQGPDGQIENHKIILQ